jgi:dipeptidase
MRSIYTWDFGTYVGDIPEAEVTYNVVGNVNEYGLIITESTFGGLGELSGSKKTGLVDYGALMWVTLQRSKTAREAIQVMGDLVTTYGYASTGESFSIADQNELWVLELIGKGRHELGAVWVARKVPDGYMTGHANQARITTFPQNDPENCVYAPDVISFARKIGAYEGTDEDFDFSATYDPVNYSGARYCEARVWSVFSYVMGPEWSNQYLDYAQGLNLTNRMPLWVKPPGLVGAADVMQLMRNHYEDLALDSRSDVGAGSFHVPIRDSPIQWSSSKYPDKQFHNERTIAQSPTGWNIVCQSRPNVPREMAALEWFGIDDSSTSVHFPIYGSATRIPDGWSGLGPQDGATPPMMTFSMQSAFYVFNLVSNWAYTRWNVIYPDVYAAIIEKETSYFAMVAKADAEAQELFATQGTDAAVEFLTAFSNGIGKQLLSDWANFFGSLFVKFRDGFITTALPTQVSPVCGCTTKSNPYVDDWYTRIAEDTGDRYLVPADAAGDDYYYSPLATEDSRTISKLSLRAFN